MTNPPSVRRVREITAERENYRVVPLLVDGTVTISRRDPVEPEPVGTIVALVFRVTGYDPDCDGSLMARLDQIDADGHPTGWRPDCLGLYPGSGWVLDSPDTLDRLSGDG